MKTCSTCRYWNGDKTANGLSRKDYKEGFGVCDHPSVSKGHGIHSAVRINSMDAPYYVLTGPDFCCVHHKPE